MWFIVGLVGRWTTLGYAARASDLASIRTALSVSARFERMVIIGSMLVLILGIVTAVAQGRPLLGPLQGAPIDWLFASLVIYVSIIPLVPLVFLPAGRRFDAALEEASAKGVVTDRLRVAFREPAVVAAHIYELIAVLVVPALMITKPF